MSGKIVVIGSSNTDMILQMEHIPRPGETILGGQFSMAAGGKGANQATEALDASALYLVLFPNFALGLYGDSVISILAIPEGPDKTREQFDVYVWGYVEPTPALIEGWLDLNKRINAEDINMIEGVQAGFASPVMRQGTVLSPHWETCVQQFEKLVLDNVRRSDR